MPQPIDALVGAGGAIQTGQNLLLTPDNQAGPFERAVKRGLEMACRGYARSGLAGRLSPIGAGMQELCDPWYNDQGYTPPSSPRPFPGGQCPVAYRIDATGQNSGFGPTATTTFLDGPLDGPFVIPSGGTLGDGSPGFRAVMTGSGGTTNQIISAANMTRADAETWTVSVTRSDNQPDNCGDPPPQFKPGNAPVYNYGDTETYIDNDNREIDITVEAPTVNIDGSLSLKLNLGGIVIDGLGGPSEGSPGGEPPPVDAGPEIPGDELGGDNGEFPPPPEGQEWVGAVLRLESDPPGQPPLPNSAASPVYPRIYGNFRLKLQSANGVGFLSENSPVREREQSLIRQSEGLTVTGARVNLADSSIQYVVIPLSALKPGE